MNFMPTVSECKLWIVEQCQLILRSLDEELTATVPRILQIVHDTTVNLINALDVENDSKQELLRTLKQQCNTKYREQTLVILKLCDKIGLLSMPSLSTVQDSYIKEEQRLLEQNNEHPFKQNILADGFSPTMRAAYWFRRYFVGKPYITLIGPVFGDASDIAVISVVKETADKTRKQYRIVIRTKQNINMTFTVNDLDVKDFVLQLESIEQITKLDLRVPTKQSRPLRSLSSTIGFSTAHHNTEQQNQIYHHAQNCAKLMRAALLFLFQDIDFSLFEELSAEITILSGLEKELLRYDEIGIPKFYKFGILTIHDGQNTEEEWFSNTVVSAQFKAFLDIIGKPIKLRDYKGYTGGLDTKADESGDLAYVSTWKGYEIVFHVAPLMPSRSNDLQQVHRKRYIGNDITCIIFLEGENQKFDPDVIRSQFIHIFVIVKQERRNGKNAWRVEVVHRKEVEIFPPFIPCPPVFFDDNDFREFILAKLINGEISALESAKFSLPTSKAKLSMLDDIITTGIAASKIASSINNCTNASKDGRWTGRRSKEKSKLTAAQDDEQTHGSGCSQPLKATVTKSPQLSFAELTRRPSTASKHSLFNEVKSLTRRKSAQPYRRSMKDFSGQFKKALTKGTMESQQEGVDVQRAVTVNAVTDLNADSLMNCGSLQNRPDDSSVAVEKIGLRLKAQHLMASMIGRRKTLTKRSNGSMTS